MGLNWSEGLGRLGQGLGTMANYAAQKEATEAQRYAEERRDAANRAFQERIIGLQQQHGKEMMQGQQEFQAGESALNREQQAGQFEIAQGNVLKMHQASMGVQQAQLAATNAAREQQVKDSATQRQLTVLTLGMNAATNEKNTLLTQMQKEYAELSKNPQYQFNAEALQEAQSQISTRYADKLVAADEKFNAHYKKAGEVVDIQVPEQQADSAAGGGGGAGASAEGAPKPDAAKAIQQITSAPNFSEMSQADIEYTLQEDFGIKDPAQLREALKKIMGGKTQNPHTSASRREYPWE